MAMFDLPLAELRDYQPDLTVPDDFENFWRRTLEKTRTDDLAATFTEVDNKLAVIDTYDVSYAGFGGSEIKAWLHVPAGAGGRLPTVVQYHGYGTGRGLAHTTTLWAQAGYAGLVMDTRGQGYHHSAPGHTPDDSPHAGRNHVPGFMTAGITDPETYYYRRVYVDAVRALEAARTSPLVDPDRIVVTGGSQGGGIAIAAAGVNLGRLATTPALFSVALMDQVCPPSTVFAAYNHYGGGQKDIEVYQYNDHEGGQAYQQLVQLDWLAEVFGS
ncbi:acetylxylan esterase [Kribbella sp. NPDC050459]|uniref:acetylxylan esterase n=1 Tax=Kribbella sp. NPDC050459 TaxID=3155785 RepID=UPI0033C36E3B